MYINLGRLDLFTNVIIQITASPSEQTESYETFVDGPLLAALAGAMRSDANKLRRLAFCAFIIIIIYYTHTQPMSGPFMSLNYYWYDMSYS